MRLESAVLWVLRQSNATDLITDNVTENSGRKVKHWPSVCSLARRQKKFYLLLSCCTTPNNRARLWPETMKTRGETARNSFTLQCCRNANECRSSRVRYFIIWRSFIVSFFLFSPRAIDVLLRFYLMNFPVSYCRLNDLTGHARLTRISYAASVYNDCQTRLSRVGETLSSQIAPESRLLHFRLNPDISSTPPPCVNVNRSNYWRELSAREGLRAAYYIWDINRVRNSNLGLCFSPFKCCASQLSVDQMSRHLVNF